MEEPNDDDSDTESRSSQYMPRMPIRPANVLYRADALTNGHVFIHEAVTASHECLSMMIDIRIPALRDIIIKECSPAKLNIADVMKPQSYRAGFIVD